ncbi:MAG: hypothetical protein IKH57_23850 [Clostridia bacterium]|nr:hypothetical protein [Clostridia bacterium]MBR4359253.1 hypothetical protein [Clostridia bacterium]
MPQAPSALDITYRSKIAFRKALRSSQADEDAAAKEIFDTLKKDFSELRFGEYLKRYLYRKAEMTEPFDAIPAETFQKMILAEFSSRQVPAHFTPASASLRKLSGNWLAQKTVSRQVVLLLGFGLGMPLEDVELFLTKGLLETSLSPKDPFEVICWYCYRDALGYYAFSDLWQTYLAQPYEMLRYSAAEEKTARLRKLRAQITDTDSLRSYLSHLPRNLGAKKLQSVTAREHFERLFEEACVLCADIFFDQDEKNRKAKVTAAGVESILYASIPRDSNGNLLPAHDASLHGIFSGKRLTRQRISDILSGGVAITRYDLMTLSFLNMALREDFPSQSERARAFHRDTDRMLEACGMRPIYPANPYESFLALCIATEDPLYTFADVFELCYAKADDQ